jgi:hypothetical protein
VPSDATASDGASAHITAPNQRAAGFMPAVCGPLEKTRTISASFYQNQTAAQRRWKVLNAAFANNQTRGAAPWGRLRPARRTGRLRVGRSSDSRAKRSAFSPAISCCGRPLVGDFPQARFGRQWHTQIWTVRSPRLQRRGRPGVTPVFPVASRQAKPAKHDHQRTLWPLV